MTVPQGGFLPSAAGVFLLILLVVYSSCIPRDDLDTQRASKNLELRFRRAPFRPPSVTSFEPSTKKSKNSSSRFPNAVEGKSAANIPPHVRSQLETASPPTEVTNIIPLNHRRYSQLPSSPYTTSRRRPSHKPANPKQKPVPNLLLVQNDQHAQFLQKKEVVKKQEYTGLDTTQEEHVLPSQNLVENGQEKGVKLENSRGPKFRDYLHVLEAINMTNQKLRTVLDQKSISFLSFLDFVENGATKEKIIQFLKIEDGSKKGIELKEGKKDAKEKSKPKLLTDLPFTEIVHEIIVDDSYPLAVDDIKAGKNEKGSDIIWKNEKYGNINDFIDKKINMKQSFDENYINLEESLSLPPKDSPIVTHFRTPLKKEKNEGSASIVSLTVEEKKTPKPKDLPKVLNFSKGPISKGTPDKSPTKVEKTKYVKKPSKSEIQRSNMKFVFPMKGVLIFCAILGGLAFMTILILIAYAALKCNPKKPPAKKLTITPTTTENT